MADNKDFWKDYFSDDSYETSDTGEDDTKIIPTVNEDAPMKGAEPVPEIRKDPAPANDRPLKKSGKTDDFEVDFDFEGRFGLVIHKVEVSSVIVKVNVPDVFVATLILAYWLCPDKTVLLA